MSVTEAQQSLLIACEKGHIHTIKKLLKLPKLNINVKSIGEVAAIGVAASKSEYEIVKLLMDDPRIDMGDVGKAFSRACLLGNTEMAKLIVRNGFDFYKMTDWKTLFLHASFSGDVETLKLILSHPGVDPSSCLDRDGKNAIHCACSNGKIDALKLLIGEERIDINQKNELGYTPLMLACLSGRAEVVKVLLASRREIEDLENAIQLAQKNFSWESEQLAQNKSFMVELFHQFQQNPQRIQNKLYREVFQGKKSLFIYSIANSFN